MKTAKITWSSKKVLLALILPTPKNYKIKTDIGKERLQQSLKMFGLAGNVIVNPTNGGKFMLIDGNSRLEEAKEKKEKYLWVSVPSRRLTPKEFEEMSAMYDFAKAGEVDMERIHGDLGKTKDFFDKWGMDVPMEVLDRLGGKADVSDIEYPDKKKAKKGDAALDAVNNVCTVNLFFTVKQEQDFRKMEEKLQVRFKTDNVTDTVFAAFKALTKK